MAQSEGTWEKRWRAAGGRRAQLSAAWVPNRPRLGWSQHNVRGVLAPEGAEKQTQETAWGHIPAVGKLPCRSPATLKLDSMAGSISALPRPTLAAPPLPGEGCGAARSQNPSRKHWHNTDRQDRNVIGSFCLAAEAFLPNCQVHLQVWSPSILILCPRNMHRTPPPICQHLTSFRNLGWPRPALTRPAPD